MRRMQRIAILFLLILGYIATFAGGFYLAGLLRSESLSPHQDPKSTPTPLLKIQNNDENIPQETTKFLPGKFYFDDTIILLTKNKPYRAVVASVTRNQKDIGYLQNTRLSYFDGQDWSRKTSASTINDSAIVSGELVKKWNLNVDPSRVLKQTVDGEFMINNATINFSTEILTNEIVMRSMPGYTKLLSKGEAALIVDGTSYPAYVLYTRIYSLNASEIQFYTGPLGLLTDWLVFWDSEGNMYHVDATSVDKPTPIYETHQIGIKETTKGEVMRTFQLNIDRDSSIPPSHYSFSLGSPIDTSLDVDRINSINKAPNNSYKWYMGIVEGQAKKADGQKTNGIGLVEYIKN